MQIGPSQIQNPIKGLPPLVGSGNWQGFLNNNTMEYLNNTDGLLFPIDEFIDPVMMAKNTNGNNNAGTHRHRKEHCNNLDLCLSLDFIGKYEMSPIAPYTGEIPSSLIPFNASTSCTDYDCGVHFYIDDYMFERIWHSIEKYIPILKRFSCVIGPDFSQYCDMPKPMRIWNCFRNRVVSTVMQKAGVNLIPNVTWSLPDSYEYSFDGMPTNSVIAINCTSIINNNLSKYLWYKGYNEAITRLRPKWILRYGTKMPDERFEISTYFENERLKALRNGR